MITAAEARGLKKTVDDYIAESLSRIETLIRKNAGQYNSVRYELEEFNERFHKERVIRALYDLGFHVELEEGSYPVLLIRWDNFTINSDGNA